MRVKLPQRIDDGEKSVAGKSCEGEDRNANWQVLEELGELANELAPRPAVEDENGRGEGNLQRSEALYDRKPGGMIKLLTVVAITSKSAIANDKIYLQEEFSLGELSMQRKWRV